MLVKEYNCDPNATDADGTPPLVFAIQGGGSQAVVEYLIKSGADPEKGNNCGITPLHHAARQGCCEIAEYLLSKGANVDPICQDGESPLQVAARHGHARMVKLLLKHNANGYRLPNDLHTPLVVSLFSSSLECLQTFVEAGADVNTDSPVTPLLVAARQGLANCIKVLLNNDADTFMPDEDGKLPWEIAALKGWVVCVEMLLPETKPLQKYADLSIDQIVQQETTAHLFEECKPIADGVVAFIEKGYAHPLKCHRVLAMDFIRSALAFLVEAVKNFLADFDGAAGRIDPRDSSLWWIIHLCSHTRWTADNSLSENHYSLGALHILRLCFSKGRGITPRLISANACSIINQIVRQSMLPMEGSRPRNSVIVCFDGSTNEFKQSYRGGIEGIRLWCYANGKRVKLPEVYGPNLEVYTTPAGGSFYLTILYKGRHIVLLLAGRSLYFMGWRSEHGTFELKPDSQTEQYMADDSCIILDIPKNFGFLTQERKVVLTWMGPIALRQSFEILYKCRGLVSDELKRAVGILAVHFCEAARIQSIFNDSCSSFEFEVSELDSKNKSNSYWVNNYDDLAGVAMSRADLVDKGEIPTPISIPSVEVTSEMDIFRQLRILPRDAYKSGIFQTEKRKSPISEGPHDDVSMETKSGNKRSRSERRSERKAKRWRELSEDPSKGGEDGGYPPFSLLDDWGDAELEVDGDVKLEVDDDQKDIKQEDDAELEEDEEDDDQKDTKPEGDAELEEDGDHKTKPEGDAELEEDSDHKTKPEGDAELEEDGDHKDIKENDEYVEEEDGLKEKQKGPNNVSIDDYLDHFNMVRKIINLRIRRNLELELPIMIDRPSVVRQPFDSYGVTRPKLKDLSFSAGKVKSDLVTHFNFKRPQGLQRNRIFQRNVFRVCSVIARIFRFI